MAKFCLDCWNKMNGTNDPAKKYIPSGCQELCEGCGEWKRMVMIKCRGFALCVLRRLFYPVVLVLYTLWRVLTLPVFLLVLRWQRRKDKNLMYPKGFFRKRLVRRAKRW